jgi:tetratricopeptide (TPR) repeat protein
MLGRLDERLKLLSGGARDLPQRQQTLRDTLAWSYDLLGETEQKLFARLGVFVGGFTLDAAEEVCEAPLDDLASLVDKSLLRRMDERLTMLETIREYARERLAASSESEMVHGRHAAFYRQLAEAAYSERIEREREWAERLEHEHDNLRAALDWFARNDPGSELRLAGALGWFWRVRSHLTEGRERLASILERQWERNVLLARAMTSAGTLASWQGDLDAARPLLEAGIDLWREHGDEAEEAHSLEALGWGFFMGGLDAEARTQFERSLDLHKRAGDKRLINRAQLAFCVVLVSQGDLELAEPLSREALILAEEQGDAWGRHLAHHYLADCALIREDYPSAEERYGRSLREALALGDRSEIAIELQGVAMAAAGRSRPKRALRLAAAAETEFAALGVDFSGIVFWSALLEKNLGRARYELGSDLAAAAWDEGLKLGIERAVDEAVAPEPPT